MSTEKIERFFRVYGSLTKETVEDLITNPYELANLFNKDWVSLETFLAKFGWLIKDFGYEYVIFKKYLSGEDMKDLYEIPEAVEK